MTEEPKLRGFASLDPERRKEIARLGGKSVPPEKRSFFQNRALAASAGSIGGKALEGHKRSFATNPALAAEAGKKGGLAPRRVK